MTTPQTSLPHAADDIVEFYEFLASRVQDAFDNMINGTLAIDVTSGSVTLSEDQARGAAEYRLTGTPSAAFVVTLPSTVARAGIVVSNDAGQTATITYGGGTSVDVPSTESRQVVADKTDVRERGAGLGASQLDVRKDDTAVASAAAFLNFIGSVTAVARDGGVDLTIAGANGVEVREGGEQLGEAPALYLDFASAVFDISVAPNGGVSVTLSDLLVDEEGNPVGFASNLPVFENANLKTENAEALNFVGFRTTVSQSGTVNIFAEGLTVRTYAANGFLGASAANAMVRSTAATAITLTIEDAQSAGFEPGTLIGGVVVGDGVVTIEGAGGVSLNGLAAGAAVVGGAGTHFSLVMLAQDDWWLAVGEVPA
ncbi:MAG: hypothetical protein AAFR84_02325 [Pseudomonadota bacterium]